MLASQAVSFLPKVKSCTAGRTSIPSIADGALGGGGNKPVYHYIDGLIDELKIWDSTVSDQYMLTIREIVNTSTSPVIPARPLPELPHSERFAAFYTDLKYYESWDNFWRTSGLPDVVISFGKSSGHFVFWRGTSYIPHWVTENRIWYNDEFNETWSEHGCHEPMSDKRNHFSHVRIIESSPARAVVHWRYALIDNWYRISNVDSLSGWGDWSDEIYTIYPDGTAIRSQTLHSSKLSSSFEWHEGIIVMGQGQRPEDVLHPEALVMANMKGEEHIYSWAQDTSAAVENVTYVINKKESWLTELADANIQLVNTRSSLKPFTIINPNDEPRWDFYNDLSRQAISIFPWWNHWPTAFHPSDGRYAMDSDRASHSSLTHAREWKPYKKTEYSETRLMMVGLTRENASGLAGLAKSWSDPARSCGSQVITWQTGVTIALSGRIIWNTPESVMPNM
jgi:hypothetical protein